MHIRPAQSQDIKGITFLAKQLLQLHSEFDTEYYQLEESFEDQFKSWISNHLNSSNQFVYVAETDNPNPSTIGFISGFIKSLYPWFRHKSVGHITYLTVSPSFRRRSVGKLLETAALSWFKSKNVSYIEVYTDEKNKVGGIVWHSYGYLPFKKFLRKKL